MGRSPGRSQAEPNNNNNQSAKPLQHNNYYDNPLTQGWCGVKGRAKPNNQKRESQWIL